MRETTPNIPDAVVKAGGAAVNKVGWTCHDGTDEPGRYTECEDCAKTCDEVSRAVLAAALPHLHPVVTHDTEDDFLEAAYDDEVVIRDQAGEAWTAWETEDGDWFAIRPRSEDDERGPDGDPWRPVGPKPLSGLWFPVRCRRVGLHRGGDAL